MNLSIGAILKVHHLLLKDLVMKLGKLDARYAVITAYLKHLLKR